MTRVLFAPSADLARATLASEPVKGTVEAEYGSFVAEGTVFTAAHHQPHLKHRPAPCNDESIPVIGDGVVLVSHVDLDTFGGCLRALGFGGLFALEHASFWALAQFIDLNGAHKVGVSGASATDIRRLHAFWAWSKLAVPRLPRDQVVDVTDIVLKANVALTAILLNDEDILVAGDRLREEEHALNTRSFNCREGDIIVRIAGFARDFVNHLYADPSGVPAKAVVCYNRENGSVTISLADPIPGVSCRGILQALWGPEAGGHDGIAGSPREKDMGEEGLWKAVGALRAALEVQAAAPRA